MRTITQTFEVYSIGELDGINRRNAITATSNLRVEAWQEFESGELLQSMQRAAQYFGMGLTDWSFGLFSKSFVQVDSSLFDDEQAPYALEWVKENHKEGREGSCPFTGHHFDCSFFDFFGDKVESTEKTIKRDIVRAIIYMMEHVIDFTEADILDDEACETYAEEQGLEFFKDGTIFHGEDDDNE